MNTIIICIIIYCAINALIIAFVPAARKTWTSGVKRIVSLEDIKRLESRDMLSPSPKRSKFTWISIKILFVLLCMIAVCFIFILSPFLIQKFIKDERNNVKKISTTKDVERDYNLCLSHLGGVGKIICSDCGHTDNVISFIHGFDENDNCNDGLTGYQCQSCGEFHILSDTDMAENERSFTCSCGGELSRDKSIFCPKCKSYNMDYLMNCIT